MMFPWNTTNGKWKRVYSQFLYPMIQLYTKATAQTGGTTPSLQRDLILLVNRPSSWRSAIFFHWSDRGIVRVLFCYSALLRVVGAPSLPSSLHALCYSHTWANILRIRMFEIRDEFAPKMQFDSEGNDLWTFRICYQRLRRHGECCEVWAIVKLCPSDSIFASIFAVWE